MGNETCLKDVTEKKDIVTKSDDSTKKGKTGTEITKSIENRENQNIYSGSEIFIPGKKTQITTLNEAYKEFQPLSFRERKEIANVLINERTEESIKKALIYDNTSFNIIFENYDFQNNKELFHIFNENISQANFEKLILEIITSSDWDKLKFSEKFKEYNNELNNRVKFNQPINSDNKGLFFYKSKIHLLINLLGEKNILLPWLSGQSKIFSLEN